jgi:hypothetical protein
MNQQAKKLDDVLHELIDQLGLSKRLEEQRVISDFESIMGQEFCKRAKAVRIEHGVLYLQVINSVWRQELYYQKTLIIERINDAIGHPMVREVVFR